MGKAKRKLSKVHRKNLQRLLFPVVLVLIGISVGWLGKTISNQTDHPRNLIWAIDETVAVPTSLRQTLQLQDSCKAYRGPGTPRGVGLWAVQQISKEQFAKVVHGCSWGLDGYVMLVKQDDQWQVLDNKSYFPAAEGNSGRSALPNCKILETYSIDQTIEPFCIEKSGKAKANAIK